MTVIDLFAGCGGLSTGLRAAGFRPTVAIECDGAAAETYHLNHPGTLVFESDVRRVRGADLPAQVFAGSGPRLLAAGLPCQTFSHAGPKSRASFDGRQVLFRDAVRLAAEVRADVVLFECVPAIRTKALEPGRPDLVIDTLRTALDGAGFLNRTEAVLDAADFGVSQKRKRWFLLAARDRSLSLRFPTPTTPGRPVTVREALAGLPTRPGPGYTGASSPYADRLRDPEFWGLAFDPNRLTRHEAPPHRAATVVRYALVRPGERVAATADRLGPDLAATFRRLGILPQCSFAQKCRLHPDRPAPTLTGHCGEELSHPRTHRVITLREAARLQSFPDGYRIAGRLQRPNNDGRRSAYAQVGNAVPCLLAYHLGTAIREVLR